MKNDWVIRCYLIWNEIFDGEFSAGLFGSNVCQNIQPKSPSNDQKEPAPSVYVTQLVVSF